MRKVTIEVKVKLTVNADEGVDISEVVNELEYDFSDTTTQADVEDMEIIGYEITDSR